MEMRVRGKTLNWRKTKHSMNGGNCVEVADGILVRDSKNPDGVILRFDADTWNKFIKNYN